MKTRKFRVLQKYSKKYVETQHTHFWSLPRSEMGLSKYFSRGLEIPGEKTALNKPDPPKKGAETKTNKQTDA